MPVLFTLNLPHADFVRADWHNIGMADSTQRGRDTGHTLPSHRHQATGGVSPHIGEARQRVRPGRDALGLGAQ